MYEVAPVTPKAAALAVAPATPLAEPTAIAGASFTTSAASLAGALVTPLAAAARARHTAGAAATPGAEGSAHRPATTAQATPHRDQEPHLVNFYPVTIAARAAIAFAEAAEIARRAAHSFAVPVNMLKSKPGCAEREDQDGHDESEAPR